MENVIGIDWDKEQYTGYLTKLISGADRYAATKLGTDFIENGGK